MSNSPVFSAPQVASLLGVGVDVVRRWCDDGSLQSTRTAGGQRSISGAAVATLLVEQPPAAHSMIASSARNQFRGIVTHVERDTVAARVEIRCGDHRIVSLMTAESVDELGLEPGVVAVASMKSTNVTVELQP